MTVQRSVLLVLVCCGLVGVLVPQQIAAGTVTFEGEIDGGPATGPWMFDSLDGTPYVYHNNCWRECCGVPDGCSDCGAYAYVTLVWHDPAVGNTDCCIGLDGGSGHVSFGNCTAENTDLLDGIAGVTIEFDGFELSNFVKRNWENLGHSGDHRVYTGGTGTIKVDGVTKLATTNCRISMDVDWPDELPHEVGPGSHVEGSGWGTIDVGASHGDWVAEFDNGNGQVEFDFSSVSPTIQQCWGSFEFELTVKSAPNQENIQALEINAIGAKDFANAKVALNVGSFAKGGPNEDLDAFLANQIMKNPGGTLPAGIEVISPYCHWELGTVLGSITTSITFDLAGMPGIETPANLRILQWGEDTGDEWEVHEDFTLVDATHIRANGVTSFSKWGIGSTGDNPLAVTLSTFSAVPGDGVVTLRWTTEAEIDNLGFHLYRSLSEEDGYERITADLIEGAGSSSIQHTYSFTDPNVTNGVTYWYKLEDVDFEGRGVQHRPIAVTPQAKAQEEQQSIPDRYDLSVNVPNPFNPQTTIAYQLPEESEVTLIIRNAAGQTVRTLVAERKEAGRYEVVWDSVDDAGKSVAAGVYLYELKAGDFVKVRKMTLLR